jgi:hypothetical protein
MTARLTLAIAAALVAAGCRETTAPAGRRPVPITDIQVPAHGTTTDTVLVSFRTNTSACDTSVVTTAERRSDGIRFAASDVPDNGPCPLYVIQQPATVYAVLPPHALPLTFSFAEPNAPDSVRTVAP